MVIVPALLMVSTIRFRSFKTIDLQMRRPYTVLLLIAVGIMLIATHAQAVLVAMAYTYLASAFIGMAITRIRHRGGTHARPNQRQPSAHRDERRRLTPRSKRARDTARRRIDYWLECLGRLCRAVTRPAASSSPSSHAALAATSIVPPFSSMFRFAIVRPSPVPVALVEKYGSKMRAMSSGSMPTPVSVMETTTDLSARSGSRRCGDRQAPAAGHGVNRIFDDVGQRAREQGPVD